jgi:hypothetical protein
VIAEHDSKDRTVEKARELARKYKKVLLESSSGVSKSAAIRDAWLKNRADIMIYTDIDLSAELYHMKDMVNGILEGNDIVIASRNIDKRGTERKLKREVLTMIYNFLIRIFFNVRFTDFQCGLKAINRKVLCEIIPKMRFMEEGFMDTELLIIAAKKNYKIKEIAVRWKDTRATKFSITKVAINFFGNLFRLKRAMWQNAYGKLP